MRNSIVVLFLAAFTASGQSTIDRCKKLYEEKNYAEAERILKTVDNEHVDYAAAQFYLGRVAFDQKKFDDASDYFEEATENKAGQISEYYTFLGDTYGSIANDANVFRQGMLAPKMKNAWEKAIALDAKNLNARFSLIQFYTKAPSLMGGSMDKAKEMARQITAINPAAGHRSMGNLLVQEEKIEAAEKEYVEMVKTDPAFFQGLGNFYVNQKKFDKAFALLDALDENQRKQAILNYQVTDLVLGPGKDGKTIQPEGLMASAMNDKQRTMLLDVVSEWAGIVHEKAATARMAEIKAGLGETWFAWSGTTTATPGRNGTSYYRIQGPNLVIEYAPQRMGGDASMHIHTIYRDPTNDYGRKLTAK